MDSSDKTSSSCSSPCESGDEGDAYTSAHGAKGAHNRYRLQESLRAVGGEECQFPDFEREAAFPCQKGMPPPPELIKMLPDLYCPPWAESPLDGCVCGKRDILEMHVYRHKHNGTRIVLGSKCVEKFDPARWKDAKREQDLWKQCDALKGGPSRRRPRAHGNTAPPGPRVDTEHDDSEGSNLKQVALCLSHAVNKVMQQKSVIAADKGCGALLSIRGRGNGYTVKCGGSVEETRTLLVQAREHITRQREAYRAMCSTVDADAVLARGLARDPQRVLEHVRLMMRIAPQKMPAALWGGVLSAPQHWVIAWSSAAGAYTAACTAKCRLCMAPLSGAELLRPYHPPDVQRTCDACFQMPLVALQMRCTPDGCVVVCIQAPSNLRPWCAPTEAFLRAHYLAMANEAREHTQQTQQTLRMYPPPWCAPLPLATFKDMSWVVLAKRLRCPGCGLPHRLWAESLQDLQEQVQGCLNKQCELCESRAYFCVPYDRKDEAKDLGARWDPEAKKWYVQSECKRAVSGMEKLFGASVSRR